MLSTFSEDPSDGGIAFLAPTLRAMLKKRDYRSLCRTCRSIFDRTGDWKTHDFYEIEELVAKIHPRMRCVWLRRWNSTTASLADLNLHLLYVMELDNPEIVGPNLPRSLRVLRGEGCIPLPPKLEAFRGWFHRAWLRPGVFPPSIQDLELFVYDGEGKERDLVDDSSPLSMGPGVIPNHVEVLKLHGHLDWSQTFIPSSVKKFVLHTTKHVPRLLGGEHVVRFTLKTSVLHPLPVLPPRVRSVKVYLVVPPDPKLPCLTFSEPFSSSAETLELLDRWDEFEDEENDIRAREVPPIRVSEMVIPPRLRTFRCDLPIELRVGLFPPTLRQAHITTRTDPLQPGFFPEGLSSLTLFSIPTEPFSEGVLPQSLEVLASDAWFDDRVRHVLPDRLRELRVLGVVDRVIDIRNLPSQLKTIKITYGDSENWLNSNSACLLGVETGLSLLPNLPVSIEKVEIGSNTLTGKQYREQVKHVRPYRGDGY